MIFNRLKTAVLLATLSGLLMLVGGLIGGKDGITAALILSIIINFVTYYFSDKIVLNIYHAKKLDEEKYNWLYSMVKDLAMKSEVPMPKLWLV